MSKPALILSKAQLGRRVEQKSGWEQRMQQMHQIDVQKGKGELAYHPGVGGTIGLVPFGREYI